jgi:hypothetical protein
MFRCKIRYDSVSFPSPRQTVPCVGVNIVYSFSSLIIYCLMQILWWPLL